MDRLSAEARKAGARDGEIRKEPMGVMSGGGGEVGDNVAQFVRAEAIEKEVSDDEIEEFGWWRVFASICVDELDAVQ